MVEGTVFVLEGLLIAFTFSEAASGFDTWRPLVLNEANAIGIAVDYPVALCPTWQLYKGGDKGILDLDGRLR